jgi:iron complex transport system ATP-binding protein
MSNLQSCDLRAGYEQRIVIPELTIAFPERQITAIVGANGCGKSTLLKTFARILRPDAGVVLFDETEIHSWPSRALAQKLSVLPQASQAPDSLTVRELVSYGRYPHRRWFRGTQPEDLAMVQWALEITNVDALADRPANAISGGQQQRAWIAMTLAQGADVLLLDEPTSHLDTCHQLEVMELLLRLNRDEGKTVVMVLHDLNLAARYAQHMVAIKEGRVVVAGAPSEVMTTSHLRTVFGIRSHILIDPQTGTPHCIAYLDESRNLPATA